MPQPPDFDTNLEMNVFGPIPTPDGVILSERRRISPQPDSKSASPSISTSAAIHPASQHPFGNILGPMPDFPSNDDDIPYNNALRNGGVAHPSKGEPLENANEDTQAALNQLLTNPTLNDVGPNDHIDQEGHGGILISPSDLDPQSENDQSGSGSGQPISKKRKTGSSRANMLARGGACEYCKKRKVKCTAEQPSCLACVRANKPCVYAQKKQRSRVRLLEDRLMELEKRLDGQGSDSSPSAPADVRVQTEAVQKQPTTSSAPVPQVATSDVLPTPADSVDSIFIPDFFKEWSSLKNDQTTTPEVGFTFPNQGSELNWETLRFEPDLMTLADAAASDVREDHPWDGMDEETIASEIVRACEGAKGGLGEKIVVHLFQLYLVAQPIPILHHTVDPRALLTRLSPTSTSPPHPSLLLALIPFLLPLSPSKALSDKERIGGITARLEAPGRLHNQHALAIVDPRILDIISANNIRSLNCYDGARLLEGWGEGAQGSALAWAAGLGKLGGAGGRIAGVIDANSRQIQEKDARMRDVRYRGMLCPPPTDGRDLGQRVLLFWQVYLRDKCATIGWNFPSTLDEEEITTPLPKDNYEDPATLLDNVTMHDFLEGRANTGGTDSDLCSQMKGLCVLSKATRLYDLPLSAVSPERIIRLKRTTRGYMASLPAVNMPELGAKIGSRLQSWQILYATMMLLHLREEIDAPRGSEDASESMTKAIDCAGKVVETMEVLRRTGDVELLGYDIMGVTAWLVVGKAVFKLAIWLEKEDSKDKLAKKLRQWGQTLIKACQTVGKRSKFAVLISQSLENFGLGYDHSVGKYERTDFIE